MSVRMAYLSPSTTKPMAMPAQADLSGTPASIKAREPPQTVAMEEEPFDSSMSETQRTAYGKSASEGIRADFAAAWATQEFHFTDGERREVVMQHEVLEGIFLEEKILALHVFLGAER